MEQNRQRKNGTSERKGRTAHIAAVAVAVLLVSAILFGFFGVPRLTAHSVFSKALKRLDDSDVTVVLCDPYVKTELYPETRSVTLYGDDAREVTERLSSAFSSYRYVDTEVLLAGDLLPYLSVKSGGSAVYFYLESDSVRVQKNSTYYPPRPASESGEAVYAELYRMINELLSEDDAE